MKKNVFGISVLIVLMILGSCTKSDDPFEKQVNDDTKKIEKYLENHNITATEIQDGFYYKAMESNTDGKVIEKDDIVEFYYKISLLDGTVLEDKMEEAKNHPLLFKKGNSALWPSGLEKGVELMHVGEHYKFFLPSYLAYYSYFNNDFFPAFSNFIVEVKVKGILSEADILSEQLSEIQDFINANNYENAQKQESDLYYIKTKEGSGKQPGTTSNVTIKWTRKYLDGTIIASTGTKSQNYSLSGTNIIDGLKEGIPLMKEGEKAIFLIPSKLAFKQSLQVLPHALREELYKENSISYDIEPYSPLLYEVELISSN